MFVPVLLSIIFHLKAESETNHRPSLLGLLDIYIYPAQSNCLFM